MLPAYIGNMANRGDWVTSAASRTSISSRDKRSRIGARLVKVALLAAQDAYAVNLCARRHRFYFLQTMKIPDLFQTVLAVTIFFIWIVFYFVKTEFGTAPANHWIGSALLVIAIVMAMRPSISIYSGFHPMNRFHATPASATSGTSIGSRCSTI